MRIVVLDGYGLNPGDLSWDAMKELGDLTVYDRTSPSELLQRAAEADVLITNKTVITKDDLQKLPAVKYIGVLATGYNIVDIEAAKERGIVVTNIPAYSTKSVAQMVFAHILNITQRVGHYAHANKNGRWDQNPDFCYWDTNLIELDGKSIGWIRKYRICHISDSFIIWNEGLCLYFKASIPTACRHSQIKIG